MDYRVWFECDYNDGDYIQSECVLNENELGIVISIMKRVFEKGSNHYGRWGSNDLYDRYPPDKLYNLTESEYDMMTDLLPYHEYGIHRINDFKVTTVPEEINWREFVHEDIPIENIPDVEVTMEKVLDGYPLLFHLEDEPNLELRFCFTDSGNWHTYDGKTYPEVFVYTKNGDVYELGIESDIKLPKEYAWTMEAVLECPPKSKDDIVHELECCGWIYDKEKDA